MTKDRFDIHQHITNQIITSIEQGTGDFQLPWHQGGGMVSRPTNIASKKAYRGVNIVALWAASQTCGFSSGIWGTYRQWSEAGAQVPLPEFREERRRLGSTCDVAHIRHLAESFDVSQEMMAKIYVKAADEKVAIITSHKVVVRRVIPQAGFPYLGLRRDAPIPSDALTRVYRPANNDTISDLREVATHVWLERRGSVSAVYEQVFLQEDGWAMTLLVVDEDEADDDEDDTNWNRRTVRR